MILVINTSGAGLEFVLDNHHKVVMAEKQSVALPVATEEFLSECGATWHDITAIGIVVGPGSFTGIRMGIAYAKGIALGLNIPVVGISAFDLYLAATPDAFVAIDSGRGDFFVASALHAPGTMSIEEVESDQMKCPRTVGHKPFDLLLAPAIVMNKIKCGNVEPVVPMYLRPSYAEEQKKIKMFNKIAELHKLCFPHRPWGANEFHNLKKSGCEIVASDNGFIVWRTVLDTTEIITIGVHPDARGAGIASAMMAIMENEVRKAGTTKIQLDVSAENAPAIGLYKKLGFIENGRRPKHYDGIDAILMKKIVDIYNI